MFFGHWMEKWTTPYKVVGDFKAFRFPPRRRAVQFGVPTKQVRPTPEFVP
jgi:hypothetical protein